MIPSNFSDPHRPTVVRQKAKAKYFGSIIKSMAMDKLQVKLGKTAKGIKSVIEKFWLSE